MPTESVEVGLAAILLILIGLIPWYDARRNRKSARELNEARLEGEEQEARFERWLSQERRFFTCSLIALLAVSGAVQIWVEIDVSAKAAGLDKDTPAGFKAPKPAGRRRGTRPLRGRV